MSSRLHQLMRQHPLLFFFFLAYAFSWIMVIPAILAEWGILPNALFVIFFTIKSFGPAVAAYIMCHVTEGQAGWHQLRGGGPLGEEPGWRGFALPRMQARSGALRATLLLGVLWAFWHLPDFLTSAQGGGPDAGLGPLFTRLPLFVVMAILLAIIFTWVFNHTQGSVFIALLLHTSINGFGSVLLLFSAPIVSNTDLPLLIEASILALLILILTRGQLGYRPGQGPSLRPDERAAQPIR
ncbi:MAG: CPBP family intramembrane metalloprotease [Chloroflexales bacterium]|nr:CPBP family intramembrane metalloprotease [Chloroflexales bacterium]